MKLSPCRLLPVVFLVLAGSAGAQVVSNGTISRFPCIQQGFSVGDVVSFGSPNITVGKKLVELKARCRGIGLVTGRGRPIRFFRPPCWGNPPADYLEILEKERRQVAALKKKYTVIEIACDPKAVVKVFTRRQTPHNFSILVPLKSEDI